MYGSIRIRIDPVPMKISMPVEIGSMAVHVDPRSRYQQLLKIVGNAKGKQFPTLSTRFHTIGRARRSSFSNFQSFTRAQFILSILKVKRLSFILGSRFGLFFERIFDIYSGVFIPATILEFRSFWTNF